MKNNSISVSAGGTGGHIFPAVALAEKMIALGWEVDFITDSRGEVYVRNLTPAVSTKVIKVKRAKKFNIISWVKLIFNILAVMGSFSVRFLKKRPNVVVGFGGYASFPICASALISRVPLVLHEQNSVIGRVNKFFLNKSNCIAFGFPGVSHQNDVLKIEDQTFNDLAVVIREMEKKKPILVYLGNPVRTEILSKKNSIYTPPGEWPLAVFVVGGSQSADIFCQVVPKSLANLPKKIRTRLRVYFQARAELKESVERELETAGIRYEVSEFFGDIGEKIVNCQIIISRAGASTLSEVAVIGRPSILVPLPTAKDDHQSKNALVMQQAGASTVILQKNFSSDYLSTVLESFFSSPDMAVSMAIAALDFAKPKAGENFGLLLNHIYRKEK